MLRIKSLCLLMLMVFSAQGLRANFQGTPTLEEIFSVDENAFCCDWINIGGTEFVAVGRGAGLDLYQYNSTNPRLQLIYTVPSATIGSTGTFVNTVKWQTIGGEHYLAVAMQTSEAAPNDQILRLYQYSSTSPNLVEVFKVPSAVWGSDAFAIAWDIDWLLASDGEYYLAAGGDDANTGGVFLQVYRYNALPNPTRLERVVAVPDTTIFNDVEALEWTPRDVGGSRLLATGGFNSGSNDSDLRLWTFTPGGAPTLTQIDFENITGTRVTDVRWYEANGVLYLAIGGNIQDLAGSGPEDLRLFRLNEVGTPSLIQVFAAPISDVSADPSGIYLDWMEICGVHVLAVTGDLNGAGAVNTELLRLYELNTVTSQLEELYRHPLSELSGSFGQHLCWRELDGEPHLFVGGIFNGDNIRLLRFEAPLNPIDAGASLFWEVVGRTAGPCEITVS